VTGIDKGRASKKLLETNAEDRRKEGKPKLKRLEDGDNDLRELKVNIWRQ
jgi:hypothetical protein